MRLTKFNDLNFNAHTYEGEWELTKDHALRYKSGQLKEEFQFRGSLIAAEPDALVFSVQRKETDKKSTLNLLRLSGKWNMNPRNQIVFEVSRRDGETDLLTFKGGWRVGPNHEIIYTYSKEGLKRKTNLTRELVFSGFWDISEKNRLTYYVGGSSDSAFRVRGAFQTKRTLAKKGELRYQAGIEVNGKRELRDVILFGKWLVSRDLSLSLEIKYPQGEKRAILFGGQYAITPDMQVSVELKSRSGERLGVEIILTKDVFRKNGQAFARLVSSLQERRIEAGMKFVW